MGAGPARSGRRSPQLLVEKPSAVDGPAGDLYVSCARGLKLGEYNLPEGVEVPGAEKWSRVEAWVNARRIRKIREDDAHIPFKVFEAWVNDESEDKPTLEAYAAQYGAPKAEDAPAEE